MDLPEIALEVLARLPLKSIARFRAVKKEWKLLIDTDFFRDHFISLNSSSSVSWSIVQTKAQKLTLEIVGHHGCKVLGITKSPGSLVNFFLETTTTKVFDCTDGLVLIYTETSDRIPMLYIGNPLFQEWFRIPFLISRPFQELRKISASIKDIGLVTKIQSDTGMVVSYKIVMLFAYSGKVGFMIYSSVTGLWEIRYVTCRHRSSLLFMQETSIALNGILHWLSKLTSSIVAYDFYGGYNDGVDNDECRIIHFPSSGNYVERFRRTFTISQGFIVYFNEFYENENRTLRVWRLVKYTDVVAEAWQLLWEVNLVSLVESGIDYFPVVMHPLKSEIIYLWSMNKKSMILYNLRTHVFNLHKEFEDDDSLCMDGCVLSFNDCSEYMEKIYGLISSFQGRPGHLFFAQYVLPRWLHRLSCPPPQPS